MRVVSARHGHAAAMGYTYRCRIESRTRRLMFGSTVAEYRFVIERYFMSWEDEVFGPWMADKTAVETAGSHHLDLLSSAPSDSAAVTYL